MQSTLSSAAPRAARRVRHAWLYALPEGALPPHVYVQTRRYDHVETFKHDFFAATGLYRCGDELAVLKLNRRTPIFGLSLRWVGRLLGGREVQMYRRVQDLPGIPRLIAAVDDTGLLHEYIPGHPLGRREAVSDTFFDELFGLVRALHARQIAYVDLNKRQNILIGDDGRPYLIDFQISVFLPRVGWRGSWPLQWLLRRLQQGDLYHCHKHKRRLRPDLLSPEEAASLERLSLAIRLHRLLFRPLIQLRRRVLHAITGGRPSEVAGSDAK